VKPQPVWTETIYQVLATRKGTNLQVGIGAHLTFGGKVIQSQAVLEVVARVWLACEEWLGVMLDGAD
jgi:hypothetical protein